MEQKFTYFPKAIVCLCLTIATFFLTALTTKISAQVSCANETVLFSEDFGTGTTSTSNADVITTGLTFQETGSLEGEGTYRVIDSTQQKPEWQISGDHTPGDVNGKMLVINGQAETFYGRQINRPQGFSPGNYTASLYLMNIDSRGTCGPDALLPTINIRVEYLSQDGTTWIPLSGSPYLAAPVQQQPYPDVVWVPIGSSFSIPTTVTFSITSIRIILADGTAGGCGNDFALDDINVGFCPEGGQLPVTFLGISARQKGSGVSVMWSTSQEFNSSRFEIEKSVDGNSNWITVSSVSAAGNSATVKNYNAFDASPSNGVNYYRIKQIDRDGNFKYSRTVMVKLNIDKIGVSVLANPFHSTLLIDFSSPSNQQVSARIIDITGKQIISEKWTVAAGSSTKQFSNVSGLQLGMYILTITNANSEILYNNKVIKQ
ncbi:MAG: T9SS type A sorting domain-containing protein [Bacteroidota bacterium]|nr:T9SS type A sorting domain-containing protein [Bacteroidota bacterium]